MTTATSEAIDALNKLVETCHDGEAGFRAAAEAIHNPAMKAELMQYSRQRAEFGVSLERMLDATGTTPSTGGSISGAVHRGWIHLTRAAGNNEHAVLAACEQGEDKAVEAYRSAMNASLPSQIGAVISFQFDGIKRVHDRIRMLRDLAKK